MSTDSQLDEVRAVDASDDHARLPGLVADAHKQMLLLGAEDIVENELQIDLDQDTQDDLTFELDTDNLEGDEDEGLMKEKCDPSVHTEEPSLYNALFEIPEMNLSSEERPKIFLDKAAKNVAIANKKKIYDSLLTNFAIHEAGDAVGRFMLDRVQENIPGVLSFYVPDNMFEPWLEEHSAFIGTTFNSNTPEPYVYQKKRKNSAYASWLFRCSCKGFHAPPKIEGGISGKERKRQPSKRQGCKSELTAYIKSRLYGPGMNGQTQTLVQYKYEHNHDLVSGDYLHQQRASKSMEQRIKIMLLGGSSIQVVLQRLRMDSKRCERYALMKGIKPTRDDFIARTDVYNILRIMINKDTKKDVWENNSAFKWMEELATKGYFTFYDESDLPNARIDGTIDKHGSRKVYGRDGFLYTLVVKSQRTQAGVPVAFLMMRKAKVSTITNWLKALKEHIRLNFNEGYSPSVAVMDMGGAEFKAARNAFPDAKIFYCPFHVLQTWQRKIKVDSFLNLAEKCYFQLAVHNAEADDETDEVNDETDGGNDETDGGNGDVDSYINNEVDNEANGNTNGDSNECDSEVEDTGSNKNRNARYKREQWMICYHQNVDYAQINTNNLIEAWRRTLKMHFFPDKQQRRADNVIYMLTNEALLYYEHKDSNALNNVEPSTPAQKQLGVTLKKAAMFAKKKGRSYASFIELPSRTSASVESFMDPKTRYEVGHDFSRNTAGEINSCSCPIFLKEGECCKHIAMVMLAYDRFPVFRLLSNLEAPQYEIQDNKPEYDFEERMVDIPASSKAEQLASQIEVIVYYLTDRDPSVPFSGLIEKQIQDFYMNICKDLPGRRSHEL
ncbi:hypothetical protein BGZ76_007020 [Entomortierella beljakovae]|nr:hypothetical protein BGZ76_007020 [Entomortierella beljakovae]